MAGTPAITALRRAKIPFEVIEYEHSDHMDAGYAKDTAQVLGIDEDAVFKTLVAEVDGVAVIGVVPASAKLDLKALARQLGGKKAVMIAPEQAEKITGYVTGGISPLGTKTPLRVVIDESALTLDTIYVSGGKRTLSLGLAPADLVAATRGHCGPIAKR